MIVDFYMTRAQKPAKVIQSLLKIPGLYKMVPQIFLIGVNKMFGPDTGFKAKHYGAEKGCFHMDMLECPNMHPKLIWGRTETLGRGDDCCDFKLTVK